MPADRNRCSVVLLNMGAPSSLEEIEPYLHRLFLDPRLIRLPAGFLYRRLLARFVSGKRAQKVRARYKAIGGGSPLLENTRAQARALSSALRLPVAVAMRYSAPFAADAVASLLEQGVTRTVALSLYPQYSDSTTGSSIEDFSSAASGKLEVVFSDRHFDHPGFVSDLAVRLLATMGTPAEETSVLFTAHSIPVKYTRQGDPYVGQVQATAAAVATRAGLTIPWSLGFQSAPKFGTWHGPFIEEELDRLVREGGRRLVVCPITFAAENLETLYDLDVVFQGQCLESGITDFKRVPAPGDSAGYIETLAALVKEAQSG